MAVWKVSRIWPTIDAVGAVWTVGLMLLVERQSRCVRPIYTLSGLPPCQCSVIHASIAADPACSTALSACFVRLCSEIKRSPQSRYMPLPIPQAAFD